VQVCKGDLYELTIPQRASKGESEVNINGREIQSVCAPSKGESEDNRLRNPITRALYLYLRVHERMNDKKGKMAKMRRNNKR